MRRRVLLAASALALVPLVARADMSIAGQWHADLGHGVFIEMIILGDGHWTSQTVQNNKVVAELAGTYEQNKTSDTTGTLVFKPIKSQSRTTQEHGAAQDETDQYKLEGRTLVLNPGSSKDRMVFKNEAKG